MKCAVNVRVTLCGRKAERWGGSLEFKKWAERRLAGRWRAVVVAVDHIALVRLALNLPHRVHVAQGIGRTRVLHQRQHVSQRVVTASDRECSPGRQSDLAAILPVPPKENCRMFDDEPI